MRKPGSVKANWESTQQLPHCGRNNLKVMASILFLMEGAGLTWWGGRRWQVSLISGTWLGETWETCWYWVIPWRLSEPWPGVEWFVTSWHVLNPHIKSSHWRFHYLFVEGWAAPSSAIPLGGLQIGIAMDPQATKVVFLLFMYIYTIYIYLPFHCGARKDLSYSISMSSTCTTITVSFKSPPWTSKVKFQDAHLERQCWRILAPSRSGCI